MKKAAHPFGRKLAEIRKLKKLSQIELGKLMGVSRGMIAYYESSAKNPTVEVIENAAKALQVRLADLLDEETSMIGNMPNTKLQRLCNQLAELPRGKQKVVIEMLEGFLEKTAT